MESNGNLAHFTVFVSMQRARVMHENRLISRVNLPSFTLIVRQGKVYETLIMRSWTWVKKKEKNSSGRKRDGYKQLPVSVEFTKYGNTLFRPVIRFISIIFVFPEELIIGRPIISHTRGVSRLSWSGIFYDLQVDGL